MDENPVPEPEELALVPVARASTHQTLLPAAISAFPGLAYDPELERWVMSVYHLHQRQGERDVKESNFGILPHLFAVDEMAKALLNDSAYDDDDEEDIDDDGQVVAREPFTERATTSPALIFAPNHWVALPVRGYGQFFFTLMHINAEGKIDQLVVVTDPPQMLMAPFRDYSGLVQRYISDLSQGDEESTFFASEVPYHLVFAATQSRLGPSNLFRFLSTRMNMSEVDITVPSALLGTALAEQNDIRRMGKKELVLAGAGVGGAALLAGVGLYEVAGTVLMTSMGAAGVVWVVGFFVVSGVVRVGVKEKNKIREITEDESDENERDEKDDATPAESATPHWTTRFAASVRDFFGRALLWSRTPRPQKAPAPPSSQVLLDSLPPSSQVPLDSPPDGMPDWAKLSGVPAIILTPAECQDKESDAHAHTTCTPTATLSRGTNCCG